MTHSAPVTLTGYRHSIYTRIARMALLHKGVGFAEAEVDPFTSPLQPDHPHPFGRVPVLSHGAFTLYETSAITRYIDLAFEGPPVVPSEPQASARMAQVISIADAYAFRPFVLQVFAHRVFRPAEGRSPDQAQIAEGLSAAPAVLAALEDIAREGLVLAGSPITLADYHLAPMLGAFSSAPEGTTLLSGYPALSSWWDDLSRSLAFIASGRPLPKLSL